MRAMGLCLLGALCLHVCGCANPSQPPSLDPFLGRTTVPPPGTGLAAPESYYPEGAAPATAPQSRRPGVKTGSYTPREESTDDAASTNGWRANSSSRVRLAGGSVEANTSVDTAEDEVSAGESEQVVQADYEDASSEPEQAETQPENPIRRRRPTTTARSTETEGTEFTATVK